MDQIPLSLNQTFDLVGVNLVLQVSLLISTMATTNTAEYGATITNSPLTRSMVAKLAAVQLAVTDPVIGAVSVICGHGGDTLDSSVPSKSSS